MEKYIGNIYHIFLEILQKKDGFTVGEKLTAIEKELPNKKFFYASDKEIYEAMEKYKAAPLDEEEKLTEEEFLGWVNLKMAHGITMPIFIGNSHLEIEE